MGILTGTIHFFFYVTSLGRGAFLIEVISSCQYD